MANELNHDHATTMAEPGESRGLESLLPANSRIKLIGVGGIGCVVLEYLMVYLNSLARPLRLVLIDGDSFEPSNISRMSFAAFGNKAQIKAAEAVQRLGHTSLTVAWRGDYVSESNVAEIVKEDDLILMCVDNFVSRRVVSEHCQRLNNVALFSAGNDGVSLPEQRGTYGNVQVYIRQGGLDRTVPITRYHPEIAKATQGHPNQVGCGELVKSVPQILFTNLAVGSSLLNAFLAYTLGCLEYQEVKLDILDARCLPQFPLATPLGPAIG